MRRFVQRSLFVDPRSTPPQIPSDGQKPYRRHGSRPIHCFLPTVTSFPPRSCRQDAVMGGPARTQSGSQLQNGPERGFGAPCITLQIQSLDRNRSVPAAATGWQAGRRIAATLAWLNSPAGVRTLECPADPPRCGYAQGPAVRAGPDPAARHVWHSRRPGPGAIQRAAAGVRQAVRPPVAPPPARQVPSVPPVRPASLAAVPLVPARGGPDRPLPSVAARTSAASPDAPPARARRAERESRSAPGPAAHRSAACAERAAASVPAAAE